MRKRKLEQHDADSEEEPRKREKGTKSLSTTELRHLLDLSALDTTSEIHGRFDEIAEALLNAFHMIIHTKDGAEVVYRIMELEFYLWKNGHHEDPFTHGSEEQRLSGRWYFHRAPRKSADSSRSLTSLTGYRGGTRKGLDLTFGGRLATTINSPYFSQPDSQANQTDTSNNHGGILLRSIRRICDDTVISGPSLLVDEVLKQSGSTNIADVVENCWKGNISAFKEESDGERMFFKPIPAPEQEQSVTKIYRSPRIGLDLSHPGTLPEPSHPRVAFLSRGYRYFVQPDRLTVNGRPQTFLGVLKYAAPLSGGGPRCLSRKRMTELTGITEQSVNNYLGYYLNGYDKGSLKNFVGPAGKGAGGSPSSYLQMIGTVTKTRNEDV
ncbi:hypothetical protein VNI00_010856 [Paramarasmius palmivorus]|uniref:Uncharacterized protein n=1 Tax=Paramarasmius palmivorus TaxID=297713 RepID=A0AAW0CER4_9AGAR